MRSSALTALYVYIYIRGQVKRSREKKGPVKRSRAVLGQSQAVKIDFRRSRILIPVADGPTASTGVTAPWDASAYYLSMLGEREPYCHSTRDSKVSILVNAEHYGRAGANPPSLTVRDHVYTCRLVPCFFPQLNCHHGHVIMDMSQSLSI